MPRRGQVVLRNYQERAIEDLRDAFRWGRRAPLLVMPTGAGKTVVFAAIAASAAERGNRVLILVHRRELLCQAQAKLKSVGADSQVMSVQSLIRRLDQQPAPDLIIIDEAHHATSNTWRKILNHWPNAARLGVTATPCRSDGAGLGSIFDELILGPTISNLISQRFLSPCRIFAPPPKADLSALRTRAGDYQPEQSASLLDKPTVTGDAIEHYQRIAGAQSAIAFCCTTKHADNVAAQFQAAGISAVSLLGTTPTADRDQIVRDFAAGTIRVLVTVDVVSEGFDVPSAGCCIQLRPTKSLGLYMQQVGRVLRPAPGKEVAIVLDHVGNVLRHGFPEDPRHWSLEDAPKRKRGESVAAPSVRTCTSCFAAFRPQPLCPMCGTPCVPIKSRVIREIAGELHELKRAQIAGARREQGKARTLDQLLAIAKQRGYSPGWAYKVHNARSRSA